MEWLDVFIFGWNMQIQPSPGKRLISPEYNIFLYFDRCFGEVAGLGIEDEFRENCNNLIGFPVKTNLAEA